MGHLQSLKGIPQRGGRVMLCTQHRDGEPEYAADRAPEPSGRFMSATSFYPLENRQDLDRGDLAYGVASKRRAGECFRSHLFLARVLSDAPRRSKRSIYSPARRPAHKHAYARVEFN